MNHRCQEYRTQAQASPHQAACAAHFNAHPLHQRFMRRTRGLVAGMRLRHLRQAGMGYAQGLVPEGVDAPLQQAADQQINLQHVMAGPAAGAVDLAQALVVPAVQRGQGEQRFGDHGVFRIFLRICTV